MDRTNLALSGAVNRSSYLSSSDSLIPMTFGARSRMISASRRAAVMGRGESNTESQILVHHTRMLEPRSMPTPHDVSGASEHMRLPHPRSVRTQGYGTTDNVCHLYTRRLLGRPSAGDRMRPFSAECSRTPHSGPDMHLALCWPTGYLIDLPPKATGGRAALLVIVECL